MAILSAKEKLLILASGKATLKEINALEATAEEELKNIDKQDELTKEEKKEPEVKNEPEEKKGPEVKNEPEEKKEPEVKNEPDEKDKRIAELEKQLEESQKENVHQDNSGSVVDNDTALYNIFKSFR